MNTHTHTHTDIYLYTHTHALTHTHTHTHTLMYTHTHRKGGVHPRLRNMRRGIVLLLNMLTASLRVLLVLLEQITAPLTQKRGTVCVKYISENDPVTHALTHTRINALTYTHTHTHARIPNTT